MQTNDYEIFDFFNTNRSISEASVKKIMNSIEKIGYVNGKPILVNKDLFIIDGQHRFEACKRLGLPIIYEEIEVDEHEAIICLNINQKNWSVFDYIKSWANQGKVNYQQLVAFYEKHKLGDTNTMTVFTGHNAKHKCFRNGDDFPINPKAEEVVSFLLNAKENLNFWNHNNFVLAVTMLHKKATDKQIKLLAKNLDSLRMQLYVSEYLTAFENKINRNIKVIANRISLS